MKFFHLIWKNVFRKKTRTFLAMGSIVMVLVLIVILTSLLKALSYDQNAGGNRIVVQHATGLANFMPLAYRQRIEQIPGVVAVAPEIWFGGVYKDDKPENFFGQLSGGQEQRVAIARAIVSDPKLLVADEPTGDLDATSGEEILTLLNRLNEEFGKTIVMVTHDLKAASHAHRLVHLEKGVLVDSAGRAVAGERT